MVRKWQKMVLHRYDNLTFARRSCRVDQSDSLALRATDWWSAAAQTCWRVDEVRFRKWYCDFLGGLCKWRKHFGFGRIPYSLPNSDFILLSDVKEASLVEVTSRVHQSTLVSVGKLSSYAVPIWPLCNLLTTFGCVFHCHPICEHDRQELLWPVITYSSFFEFQCKLHSILLAVFTNSTKL